MARRALRVALVAFCSIGLATAQQTGSHTDLDRWCGKAYEAGSPSFDPGGQAVEPPRSTSGSLLYVQLAPRYSLFMADETQGEFVVRTTLSPYFGEPLPGGNAARHGHDALQLHYRIAANDTVLASGAVPLALDDDTTSVDALATFSLAGFTPSTASIDVTLTGWVADGTYNVSYTAASSLRVLPVPAGGGSVTRLDYAYGGFWHRSTATSGVFERFFPYGFYASSDGFLANATDAASAQAVVEGYAAFGLNAMTPLTQYPASAASFDALAVADVRVQFDLREQYTNTTWIAQQVAAARTNPALFSYWSADEPDGHQDPFAVPRACYDTYTDGAADVVMEDVYPIGITTTTNKWGTTCNTTMGDCGCDNCVGGTHAVRDVADRLDDLLLYESWIDSRWPTTKTHNPQSFHGEGYWARDPTPAETWAMALVAVNHGAQGILSWVYPVASGDVLPEAHGALARVLAAPPVRDFVVGSVRPRSLAVAGAPDLDVAYWHVKDQTLVSIVNSGYTDYGALAISLFAEFKTVQAVFGNCTWTLAGSTLSAPRVPQLAASLVILST